MLRGNHILLVFTLVLSGGLIPGSAFGETSHSVLQGVDRSSLNPARGSGFGISACSPVRPSYQRGTDPIPSPIDPPCYSAACCPEDIVAAVCLPAPPDCSRRVCKGRNTTSNKCDLIPASENLGGGCTQGGPLTFYYDRERQQCTPFQNLGSCHPRGPFGSKVDCESAVSSGECG